MVHRLAQHINNHHAEDWMQLAYELDLSFTEVDALEASYTRMVERLYRMIQSWLDEKGSEAASKRTLVGILCDLKWQDSADFLAGKHHSTVGRMFLLFFLSISSNCMACNTACLFVCSCSSILSPLGLPDHTN